MSLSKQADLSANHRFRSRVFAAAIKAAVAIVGEAPAGSSLPRQQLGVSLLRSSWLAEPWASSFAAAVASQASVLSKFDGVNDASVSDADIETIVAAVWNKVAGVVSV